MRKIRGIFCSQQRPASRRLQAHRLPTLPAKAKPVQYVKVCSLYGAGFYYIPGSDICFKIGGYLRAEADVNAGGTLTPAVGPGSANNRDSINNRESNSFVQRSRSLWTLDTRAADGLRHRAQLRANGDPMDDG